MILGYFFKGNLLGMGTRGSLRQIRFDKRTGLFVANAIDTFEPFPEQR